MTGGLRASLQECSLIGDVIARNAAMYSHKPALIDLDGASVTFSEFGRHVGGLTSALRGLGLGKGSRVAIISRNRVEYLEAVCVSASGLIALPLNWRLSPREIAAILEDSNPGAVISSSEFAPMIDDIFSGSHRPHLICFDGERDGWIAYAGLADGPSRQLDIGLHPDDTACLVYTSGTTGAPKGAELSHRGLLLNCGRAVNELLGLTPEDGTLAPMPFFHVGGLWYHLFPSFAAGCTTFVTADFTPADVLRIIAERRITNIHVVPAMLHALISHPDVASLDMSSLRLVFYGASTIPLSVLKGAMTAFASSGFVQGYGSTEAGMVTYLSPEAHRAAVSSPPLGARLLSCGRSFSNVEVRLSEGEVGEFLVRSPMTMSGYWRNPDATARAISNGWLATGDLGRIDDDGYCYILDRKSDMIVSGGENVYPREVEDVLREHPDVAEVAIFDLPDDRWVQKVATAIVLRAGASGRTEEIVTFARERLAHYKCPKEVFFVEILPRNGAGKVLRKELRIKFSKARSTGIEENRDG